MHYSNHSISVEFNDNVIPNNDLWEKKDRELLSNLKFDVYNFGNSKAYFFIVPSNMKPEDLLVIFERQPNVVGCRISETPSVPPCI